MRAIELGDLKSIARFLLRRPVWTSAVIAVLALGIGANLAVFSVFDSLLLRPIRLNDARGLVSVLDDRGANGEETDYATFQALAGGARSFSGLAASLTTTVSVRDDANPEPLNAALVTPRYFELLGVRPARGRLITPAALQPSGSEGIAVISHRLWRTRFGGDPAVVGRTMQVAGQLVTIVGVSAPSFSGIRLAVPIDLWLPVSLTPHLQLGLLSRFDILAPNSRARLFDVFGRLSSGVGDDNAAAELQRFSGGDEADRRRFSIAPLMSTALPAHSRSELLHFLRLAWFVAGLTLILACANVANLILVRGSERRRELGIRLALGASRRSLLRLLILETGAVGLVGTVAGVALCELVVHVTLPFVVPAGLPPDSLRLQLDGQLLFVSAGLGFLSCAAFGALPAVTLSGVRVTEIIGQRSDGLQHRHRSGVLVSVQVGVCIVLLTGAALMLRSLAAGLRIDLGFDPAPLAAVSIQPRFEGRRIDNARRYEDILARVAATPGVSMAAAMTHVPIAPSRFLPFGIGPASGGPGGGRIVSLTMESVSNGYFDVLGMRIIAGRLFDQRDGPETERVTIINEAAGRAMWPNESPIGKQINFLNTRSYTVVGVMRDTKLTSLDGAPVPFAVAPLSQEEVKGLLTFTVRARNPRQALVGIQRTISNIAPEFKMMRPRLVSDQVRALLAPQEIGAVLLSVFSVITACICCAGIYGMLEFMIAQRYRELGIRAALGASRRDLVSNVASGTLRSIAAGFCLGGLGAAYVARTLTHFLLGISVHDAMSFGISGLVMALAVCVSALRPVLTAMRLDPIAAIRTDS